MPSICSFPWLRYIFHLGLWGQEGRESIKYGELGTNTRTDESNVDAHFNGIVQYKLTTAQHRNPFCRF